MPMFSAANRSSLLGVELESTPSSGFAVFARNSRHVAPAFIVALFLLIPFFVSAYFNPGAPTGFVNDFADMLSPEEKSNLESKLVAFEQESGNEVAVVTIPSLDGDTIENFAVKLFEEWKIGKTEMDNGVLVLVALADREMRIEVGYGLEGALTDAQSFWIINHVMKPAFQEKNYYAGIEGTLDKIISATKGEYIPEEKASTLSSSSDILDNIGAFIWGGFFVLMWLASILGRSKLWWAGGVLGGVIAVIIGIVGGFVFTGIVALAVLIPFGLAFDYAVSRGYERGKATGHIPWWAGGKSGFGGRGFGGFGGGSSGGGGASGRW